MRKAFAIYVRPMLEYNSCVWNPSRKHLIDSIEAVQRRFTKHIPSLSSLSYSKRLAIINLDLLELRRQSFDLIMYYKVINNITPYHACNTSKSILLQLHQEQIPSHYYLNLSEAMQKSSLLSSTDLLIVGMTSPFNSLTLGWYR
jgi:hypothetical protein